MFSRFTAWLGHLIFLLMTVLFTLFILFAVYKGWIHRDEQILTPADGYGYALGIGGGVTMLSLLFYPLRKYLGSSPYVGSVKLWFRIHVVLGLIGPLMILYHSNFHLGSLNSRVTLFSMLLVVFSGLVGRFLYAKINDDLDGAQKLLNELHHKTEEIIELLSNEVKFGDKFRNRLKFYSKPVITPASSLFISIIVYIKAMSSIEKNRNNEFKRLKVQLRETARKERWNKQITTEHVKSVHKLLKEYFNTIRRATRINFYSRIFSLWHMLHFPLFMLLIVTGIVHVTAVHMY